MKHLTKLATHKLLTAGAVIVLAGGGYYWVHRTPADKKIVTAGTPVTSTSDNSGPVKDVPEKKSTSGNADTNRNSGGAKDTKGTTKTTTDSSQWTVSASGNITVKSPVANQTIKNGSVLSGSAKVSQIHYRLSDNKVGVIAQGALDVVNGNFSGVLKFSSQGSGGRLDVFSTDSQGVEYNEVQINVGF